MATPVRGLTNKRKRNLRRSGKASNGMGRNGTVPSGIQNSDGVLESVEGGTGPLEAWGPFEAWGYLVAGSALAAYGGIQLSRRVSLQNGLLTLLGVGLILKGGRDLLVPDDEMGQEHTQGYDNPAAPLSHLQGFKVEKSIAVEAPAEECYDFWRDFENLPRIMSSLKSVENINETHSHWIAEGPLGINAEWDAEVYMDHVGEMISWRSTAESEVVNAGSVHFKPNKENTKTRVTVMIRYDPPAGAFGEAVAMLFGDDAEEQISEALGEFKEYMEGQE